MKRQTFALLIFITLFAVGCARTQTRPCRVVDETYVHKYGVEVPREDWSSRGKHGQVISTLDNGVVVTKSFTAGQLHGDVTYTFPHSDVVERVETYANGTKIKDTTFDIAGNPQEEVCYSDNVYRIGTRWYEGGAPLSREEYRNEKLLSGEYYNPHHQVEAQIVNGSGTRLLRDTYGQLISSDEYENGQIFSSTTFHANGNPKTITPYRNSLVHGERKTFLPAGEPEVIEMWGDGNQDGVTTIFKNGERYAEIPYSNGKKNGVETHYRDHDVIVEEIAWVDDQRHGPSTTYVDSKPVKTEWFLFDRSVPKTSYDLKTGQRRH